MFANVWILPPAPWILDHTLPSLFVIPKTSLWFSFLSCSGPLDWSNPFRRSHIQFWRPKLHPSLSRKLLLISPLLVGHIYLLLLGSSEHMLTASLYLWVFCLAIKAVIYLYFYWNEAFHTKEYLRPFWLSFPHIRIIFCTKETLRKNVALNLKILRGFIS
jgi:hypothetical protein